LVLYAAMVVLLVVEAVLAVRLKQPSVMLEAAAWILALAVLQYAAVRFLGALERLNRATPARMNSTAFLDCFALLGIVAGLGALVVLSVEAVGQGQLSLLMPAVVAFIFCQYAAIIALNPETLHVTISADAKAGEEALGLFAFLVKIGMRLVPVCFGLGVIWGTFELLYATFLVLADAPGLSSPQSAIRPLANFVLWFAASPVAMYCLFLLGYLAIDCVGALLALPGKLDGLAEGKEKADEEP
jgi:hypothetical protein